MLTKLLLGAAAGLGIFLLVRIVKESQIVEFDLSLLPQKREIDLSSFPQTVDDNLLPIKIGIPIDPNTGDPFRFDFLPPLGAL